MGCTRRRAKLLALSDIDPIDAQVTYMELNALFLEVCLSLVFVVDLKGAS